MNEGRKDEERKRETKRKKKVVKVNLNGLLQSVMNLPGGNDTISEPV